MKNNNEICLMHVAEMHRYIDDMYTFCQDQDHFVEINIHLAK
jgi:hypothetical protein